MRPRHRAAEYEMDAYLTADDFERFNEAAA